MNYQVLARKWRPKSFAELIGQQHVVRALTNSLDHDRLHHAYLFAGMRGVGKTTVARILAKCLNCDAGVSSTPCGSCSACREIDEGRFVDLIEVDAASRARVEETRELMESVQFSPARGRYKVYLIDEVHMFSNHSFNALLKTLEEPPPHVKFMLATTDPQKIPVTVLSRCLQFHLRGLPVGAVAGHLERVLTAEGVSAEPAAIRLLASAAEGSLRDALSLLDQAIAYSGGGITQADVHSMLGSFDRNPVQALLGALAEGDGSGVLKQVGEMAADIADFGDALGMLLSELQRIAVMQLVPDVQSHGDGEDPGALQQLAHKLSPEDVQLYYQIGLLGRRDLPFAPDPRTGFEMILLRMLAFRPAPSEVARSEAQHGVSNSPSTAAPMALPPALSAGVDEPEPGANWSETIDALELGGIARELAVNSVLLGREGNIVRLGVAPAYAQLAGARAKEKLQAALSQHYGDDLRLELTVATFATHTPATLARRQQAELYEAAVRAIHSDPNVTALCQTFDARVEAEAVQPVVGKRSR